MSRILLTADVQAAPRASAGDGGPWGAAAGGAAAAGGPPSPLIISRSVELRACVPDGGDAGVSGGARRVLDLNGAVGVAVVAGGAALRLSGDMTIRPCGLPPPGAGAAPGGGGGESAESSGGGACLAAWPAFPAVALAPGARLELEVRRRSRL